MNEHLWGQSWPLFLDDRRQLVRISGKAGAASSLHLHAGKHNLFIVERGILDLYYLIGGEGTWRGDATEMLWKRLV